MSNKMREGIEAAIDCVQRGHYTLAMKELQAALAQQPESDPEFKSIEPGFTGWYEESKYWGRVKSGTLAAMEATWKAAVASRPQPAQVPEGFKVVPCSDGEFQGFIIRGPSVDGVRANTSVWADEADTAHALLHALLSAAPYITEKDHD